MPSSKKVRKKPMKPSANTSKVPRITYATLKITPEDDRAYDHAVEKVRAGLGGHFAMYVNGEKWVGTGEEIPHQSPINTSITVSYFPKGTRDDANAAVDAAQEAYTKWSDTPYKERLKLLRKAADTIVERRYELSAWMAFEVGKNRVESLAEVNEAAELIRYYCDRMELNRGFLRPLESPGPGQETVSVLRPYGVWAVIAPWNFPLALSTGMTAGAMATGNTVVFKPSSESSVLGYELTRAYVDAGIPRGVFNLVTGPGGTVGAELQENRDVDGMIFTGSKDVGIGLYHNFSKDYPKPVITEMGGKNPAIVTSKADIDQAAEGIVRAAFGFGGQKCSACSRVYVEQSVKEKFTAVLKDYTKKLVKLGDPIKKETFLGPLINKGAMETYLQAAEEARNGKGTFLCGGNQVKSDGFENGHFVEPAIVDNLPLTHRLFKDELFVPFLVVGAVGSLDEALELSNNSEYGLCAGIYSKDRNEMKTFFDHVEAGVTYANRRAGATTGAWPGINSFGGWKGSGSTGKSGLGPYYVQQFMREQSRWIVNK
ncbi:MAG: aldehyde dehydrogenase family protein [Candidatus Bathyarchaeia archaeon]|jgi:1-pyrroline-5-carboxylate dehydrogenase